MSDGRALFREFLRAPTQTATLTASSAALVSALAKPLPLDGAPVIVELGAGTGRVTDAVQRTLAGRGRHVAIELNPVLSERLAARHPDVTVISGDAGRLRELLSEHGVERADGIVSLLPWAAHAAAPIPALAAGVLAPGGVFTQVQLLLLHLLPPARRIVDTTRATFDEVTVGGQAWANFPPARVLVARQHDRILEP